MPWVFPTTAKNYIINIICIHRMIVDISSFSALK